MHQIGSLICNI